MISRAPRSASLPRKRRRAGRARSRATRAAPRLPAPVLREPTPVAARRAQAPARAPTAARLTKLVTPGRGLALLREPARGILPLGFQMAHVLLTLRAQTPE